MKTEIEIRRHIQRLLDELKNAQKKYDRTKIRRLNEQIAILYWVLGESYTVPSMYDYDITTNYDKFRELSPYDMAQFLSVDTDGNERSVCSVCAIYDDCDDDCLKGVIDWLKYETTTAEWMELLKKKGIRK